MVSHAIIRGLKKALRNLDVEVARASPREQRPDVCPPMIGDFANTEGEHFQLIEGYRKSVWNADWQEMAESRAVPSAKTVRRLRLKRRGGARSKP